MNETVKGWVITNENHPNRQGHRDLYSYTFAKTRTECTTKFAKGSGKNWSFWYRNYNFRCVKAEMTVTQLTPNT